MPSNFKINLSDIGEQLFTYQNFNMSVSTEGCEEYFTPSFVWMVDGILISREKDFRFMFYAPKNYLITVIANCGNKELSKSIKVNVQDKPLEIGVMSSFSINKSKDMKELSIDKVINSPSKPKNATFTLLEKGKPVKVGIPAGTSVEVKDEKDYVWIKEN